MCDVHGIEHGVDVNPATIRGSLITSTIACDIGADILARKADGWKDRKAAEDFCLQCISGLGGLKGASGASGSCSISSLAGVTARAAVKQCRIYSVRKPHLYNMQSGLLL